MQQFLSSLPGKYLGPMKLSGGLFKDSWNGRAVGLFLGFRGIKGGLIELIYGLMVFAYDHGLVNVCPWIKLLLWNDKIIIANNLKIIFLLRWSEFTN